MGDVMFKVGDRVRVNRTIPIRGATGEFTGTVKRMWIAPKGGLYAERTFYFVVIDGIDNLVPLPFYESELEKEE